MTDIIAFISARLGDDEAYALEAAQEFGPDWIEIWSGQIDLSANLPDRQPPAGRHWDAHVQTNDSRVSRHMVRHDPAHVLAEVKAKRAILAPHQISSRPEEWGDVRHHPDQDWPRSNYMGQLTGGTVYSCAICDIGVNLDADGPLWRAEEACETVRWMAAPHDQHPDYKQAWAVVDG